MDKRGEKLHILFMNLIFFSIFILVIYLLLQAHLNVITGFAVYDETTATSAIEEAFSSSYFSFVESADICLIISEGAGDHALRVQKEGDFVTVTESSGFCNGLYAQDAVIKFVSFDAFMEVISDPSPGALMGGVGGNKFYILESKFVQSGGDVMCNPEFKVKYCDALNNIGTPEDLIEGDLSCCLDELTKSQKDLLDQHLTSTGFMDETAQSRGAGIAGMSGMTIGLAAGAFIVVILVLLVVTMMKPHKRVESSTPKDPRVAQIRQYIQSTRTQGFKDAQIREHLSKEGWTPDLLDKAFQAGPAQTAPAQSTAPQKVK